MALCAGAALAQARGPLLGVAVAERPRACALGSVAAFVGVFEHGGDAAGEVGGLGDVREPAVILAAGGFEREWGALGDDGGSEEGGPSESGCAGEGGARSRAAG